MATLAIPAISGVGTFNVQAVNSRLLANGVPASTTLAGAAAAAATATARATAAPGAAQLAAPATNSLQTTLADITVNGAAGTPANTATATAATTTTAAPATVAAAPAATAAATTAATNPAITAAATDTTTTVVSGGATAVPTGATTAPASNSPQTTLAGIMVGSILAAQAQLNVTNIVAPSVREDVGETAPTGKATAMRAHPEPNSQLGAGLSNIGANAQGSEGGHDVRAGVAQMVSQTFELA